MTGPGPQGPAPTSRLTVVISILAGLLLLAGLATTTQVLAYRFQYDASLGWNFDHVYPPWVAILWAWDWYAKAPEVFVEAGGIGSMVTGAGLIGLVMLRMIGAHSAKGDARLHGSARWAEKKDIQATGLLRKKQQGVFVGAWIDKRGRQHYLRHNGPEHVLCYAPTRSGKGVGLVVPTLLTWPHSAVITDLKGELWALSAGWRQGYANNKVLRFEPAAKGGVRWNPLEEIRLGSEDEVGDVQNLATLIVDPDGKGLTDHWQKTSQALLVGVILHLLYKARHDGTPATLSTVDALLADPSRPAKQLWQEMTTYQHLTEEERLKKELPSRNHPAVGTAGRDMMDRPDEEGGSVLSTAKSHLALFRDPVVAANVSVSDFRIKDLMYRKENPVSLYIVTQPNDKARLRPLVRILINMIVRLLADKMEFKNGQPAPSYNHRLLLMLDEFPSLGKLEILQESLAFVAGYGIKCYLICQDLNQLKSRETGYGPDETITSNCHVQNAYPPNRVETAEHLSKLTGQTTVVKEQITTSGRRASALLGQVSKTLQEVQRPLLTPDEALRLPGPLKDSDGKITQAGDMVVYMAGYPAIYGRQPLYFQDPVLLARAQVEAPKNSDILVLSAPPLAETERVRLDEAPPPQEGLKHE